jgi:hypothetical protein
MPAQRKAETVKHGGGPLVNQGIEIFFGAPMLSACRQADIGRRE